MRKPARKEKIMFPQLMQYQDLGLLALRLAVGIIFVYHALPKLKNPSGMGKGIGMPGAMVGLLGAMELVAGLAVASGVYLQLGAILLAIIMVGAAYFKAVKWHMPFAAMDKTGWELDLILFGAAAALAVLGGGAWVL